MQIEDVGMDEVKKISKAEEFHDVYRRRLLK